MLKTADGALTRPFQRSIKQLHWIEENVFFLRRDCGAGDLTSRKVALKSGNLGDPCDPSDPSIRIQWGKTATSFGILPSRDWRFYQSLIRSFPPSNVIDWNTQRRLLIEGKCHPTTPETPPTSTPTAINSNWKYGKEINIYQGLQRIIFKGGDTMTLSAILRGCHFLFDVD